MAKGLTVMAHQSAELYGSDRVFLNMVSGLNKKGHEILVLLPRFGPLSSAIEAEGVEVRFLNLGIVSASDLRLRNILQACVRVLISIREIDQTLRDNQVSLASSNTLAVLGVAIWAATKNIQHIWHIHEYLGDKPILRIIYRIIIRATQSRTISVSNSVQTALLDCKTEMENKHLVIYNGIKDSENRLEIPDVISELIEKSKKNKKLIVTLAGRKNSWKGQLLLIKAVELIPREVRKNIVFFLVGDSPPGQPEFTERIDDAISSSHLSKEIKNLPFVANMTSFWRYVDIALIPSIRPEPFGLVAIEAMLKSVLVIASDRGGDPHCPHRRG